MAVFFGEVDGVATGSNTMALVAFEQPYVLLLSGWNRAILDPYCGSQPRIWLRR
jgi:hypothetical protein